MNPMTGPGRAYADGVLGAMATGPGVQYQDGSLGAMATGPGMQYQDGVLGALDESAYQGGIMDSAYNMQSGHDGVLGAMSMATGPGRAFQSGSLGAAGRGPGFAFQDGVLGDAVLTPVATASSMCPSGWKRIALVGALLAVGFGAGWFVHAKV